MNSLFILLSLIATSNVSLQGDFREELKNNCSNNAYFHCHATQRLDDHHIVLACGFNDPRFTVTNILQMKRAPTSINSHSEYWTAWQLVGTQKAQLQNGFETSVDVWKECNLPKPQQ